MNSNYEVKVVGDVLNHVSAFGLADAQIGFHIYAIDMTPGMGEPIVAGNAPFTLKLKLNGFLIRTITDVPACLNPGNTNIDPLQGEVEWNYIATNLPAGNYTGTIEDSLSPPNDCRFMAGYNIVQPPKAIIPGDAMAMGYPTQVWIDYGLTINYDNVAELGMINGFATVPFTLELQSQVVGVINPTGYLLPGTTYHYRIRATNQNGTSVSQDMQFTTPIAPPPPLPIVHIYSAIVT